MENPGSATGSTPPPPLPLPSPSPWHKARSALTRKHVSLSLKAPLYLRCVKSVYGPGLHCVKKYPFTGDFGNTNLGSPRPRREWKGGGGGGGGLSSFSFLLFVSFLFSFYFFPSHFWGANRGGAVSAPWIRHWKDVYGTTQMVSAYLPCFPYLSMLITQPVYIVYQNCLAYDIYLLS